MSLRNIHRLTALAACGGLLCLAASSAGAQSASAPAPAPAADKTFAQKAAVGGMTEVQLSKLAQQKAMSNPVKEFASRMVDDHTKANDELKQIASTKGMDLPTELDAKGKATMAKLGPMTGGGFDRAYMRAMLDDHSATVALFTKEAKSGRDSDLKGFASTTLPTIKDHLKMAQMTDVAGRNGKPMASAASASR